MLLEYKLSIHKMSIICWYLQAYTSWKDRNGKEPALPGFEHFSNDQMFFLAWGQVWRDKHVWCNHTIYGKEPYMLHGYNPRSCYLLFWKASYILAHWFQSLVAILGRVRVQRASIGPKLIRTFLIVLANNNPINFKRITSIQQRRQEPRSVYRILKSVYWLEM